MCKIPRLPSISYLRSNSMYENSIRFPAVRMMSPSPMGQILGPLWLPKRILNSKCLEPNIDIDNNSASEVAQDMLGTIKFLYSKFLSLDGKSIDYSNLAASIDYQNYLGKAEELNRINLSAMTQVERKAFFLNIYNALVIHALIDLGRPRWLFSRLALYATASYNIDGIPWSLNDIENGALRGNRRSAAPWSSLPIPVGDPRLKYKLDCDPRIHFALNCGAVSCPPIRFYEVEKLEYQLDIATKAFVNGMSVSEKGDALLLSQIFKWYECDFGSTDRDVLEWIKPYLSDPQKISALNTQLQKDNVQCMYESYNWSINQK